jgi:hypothetical protein
MLTWVGCTENYAGRHKLSRWNSQEAWCHPVVVNIRSKGL